MKTSKIVEKKIQNYIERYYEVDRSTLSDDELKQEKKTLKTKLTIVEQIAKLPKRKALALLNKLEEQDDYIKSLECSERELFSAMNDYQKNLQHNLDTGWFYPDNDDDIY